MDEENISSWISQPDVCRCCLSASGSLDVTATYETEAGSKEIFTEMLQECYGIGLSGLTEWGSSRLVCRLCVGHLRDACSFRKQVLTAEKLFIDHWIGTNENINRLQIKSEIQSVDEIQSPAEFAEDWETYVDNFDKIKVSQKSKVKITVTAEHSVSRKRRKTHLKVNRKKDERKFEETDSDTPISNLTNRKVNVSEDHTLKNDCESEMQDNYKNETATRILRDINEHSLKVESRNEIETCKREKVDEQGRPPQSTQSGVKQLSERRRLMLTCNTVLRDTTACPFRHHKSWFQCFFCPEDFIEINQLRHHVSQAHADIDAELKKIKRYPRSLQIEISNLACRHCGLILKDVETMRLHLDEMHKKVIYSECIADYKVNGSPYTCHLCGKQYHVFRTLTTHLNEHYANCICDVCGKSFLNTKRLKVHKRTHENGQYPCGQCGKVLKTKTSKANHMESAHSNRVIKCQICFKPMKHYNQRIKHMSESHNITHKFKCPICSREYNIKHYLATHMRQTHGHKNKKCGDCGMAFITNHGLKKHMLRHTGVKAFSCTVCSKSYARSYTLKEHMRAHEGDKRFLGSE